MPRPTLAPLPVARARIEDMLQGMQQQGFNHAALAGAHACVLTATRSDDGRTATVTVRLQVTEAHANPLGMLHGGAAATLVDVLTSLPVVLVSSGEAGEPWSLLGVSTSINTTYLSASPVGSWLDFVARIESVGRSILVLSCDVFDVPDGQHGSEHGAKRLTAMHTKFDNSGAQKARL